MNIVSELLKAIWEDLKEIHEAGMKSYRAAELRIAAADEKRKTTNNTNERCAVKMAGAATNAIVDTKDRAAAAAEDVYNRAFETTKNTGDHAVKMASVATNAMVNTNDRAAAAAENTYNRTFETKSDGQAIQTKSSEYHNTAADTLKDTKNTIGSKACEYYNSAADTLHDANEKAGEMGQKTVKVASVCYNSAELREPDIIFNPTSAALASILKTVFPASRYLPDRHEADQFVLVPGCKQYPVNLRFNPTSAAVASTFQPVFPASRYSPDRHEADQFVLVPGCKQYPVNLRFTPPSPFSSSDIDTCNVDLASIELTDDASAKIEVILSAIDLESDVQSELERVPSAKDDEGYAGRDSAVDILSEVAGTTASCSPTSTRALWSDDVEDNVKGPSTDFNTPTVLARSVPKPSRNPRRRQQVDVQQQNFSSSTTPSASNGVGRRPQPAHSRRHRDTQPVLPPLPRLTGHGGHKQTTPKGLAVRDGPDIAFMRSSSRRPEMGQGFKQQPPSLGPGRGQRITGRPSSPRRGRAVESGGCQEAVEPRVTPARRSSRDLDERIKTGRWDAGSAVSGGWSARRKGGDFRGAVPAGGMSTPTSSSGMRTVPPLCVDGSKCRMRSCIYSH
ncbi:hypothetical protein HK101_006916 [Irineochytrium annulatum]|nr:hypothetical protein HK101_006916 [Irineochytrium annulatum]